MKERFATAKGSVIGRNHALRGNNNQDAAEVFSNEAITLAVVCDGCGSCPYSEVGAKLGAKLWIKTLFTYLQDNQEIDWQQIQEIMLEALEGIVIRLALTEDLAKIIHDYFLFTLIGVVITPQVTTIVSLGDGVIAVNEKLTILPDFPNNAPTYLAYQLINSHLNLNFQIHYQISTQEVDSILIGSDGVKDLLNLESQNLRVTHLHQFWQNDRYFNNPDLIRRHLFLMNRDKLNPDWQTQTLNKEVGLLADDTTLVVIKKRFS